MKLVIIESGSKRKKLSKLLSQIYGRDEFTVIASSGHVRDLPPKDLGVDIDNGFRPKYVTARGKSKVIKMLARKVSESAAVYLAADPDREGESIAWHIIRVTKPKVPVYRVTFNEITLDGVRRGFDNPRELDMNLVAAQEARRILDRLVGYKVSPALWRGLDESGLSAGRVQSAALKLVVDRHDEIENFEPEEYWSVSGVFAVKVGDSEETFEGKLVGWKGQQWSSDLFSEDDANEVVNLISDALFYIKKVKVAKRHRNPMPPFTTSSLQQAASSHLKISPDKTMSVAQTLYDAGHITYLRTDSPAVSIEAANAAEEFIKAHFGDVYLPEERHTYKAKSDAQESHECIRPTDVTVESLDDLDDYSARLYQLIWRRFIASQMTAAIYERTTVYVAGGDSIFMTRTRELIYDGFLRVYMYGADTDENMNDNDDVNLPPLSEGQTCDLIKAQPEQHFTRAPATYSEASLIKALEDAGIGRPSTYSMMVSVIRQRKYARVKKRRLVPTRLGQKVAAFLHTHFDLIMNQDFTRTMEASLDKIATGNLDTRHFLGSFWSKFEPLVQPWDYAAPRPEPKTTDESCPVCAKGQLVVRSSKKGRFIGCSRYPRCKYSRDINIPAPVLVGKKCPECKAQLCVRSRRNSDDKFVGCTNYPHCRHTENFNPKPTPG